MLDEPKDEMKKPNKMNEAMELFELELNEYNVALERLESVLETLLLETLEGKDSIKREEQGPRSENEYNVALERLESALETLLLETLEGKDSIKREEQGPRSELVMMINLRNDRLHSLNSRLKEIVKRINL